MVIQVPGSVSSGLPELEQQPQDPVRVLPPQSQTPTPLPEPEPASDEAIRSSVRSFLADRSRQQEQSFLNRFQYASETNPDRWAEAREVATTLGVDPDTAMDNMDVLKSMWRKRQVETSELAKKSPILAKEFDDLEFARLAHDDVESLGFFEGMWASLKAGVYQTHLGGLAQQTGAYADSQVPKPLTLAINEARRTLRHLPQQQGFFWGAANVAGQVGSMLPEAIGTGAALATIAGVAFPPGSPVTAPAAFIAGASTSMMRQIFTTQQGLDFDEFSRAGYDRQAAWDAATASASVITLLEGAGMFAQFGRPLIAPIKAMLRKGVADALVQRTKTLAAFDVSKSYLLGVAAETGEEGLSDVVSMLAEDWASKQKGAKEGADLSTFARGEAWERFIGTVVATAQASAVLGGVPEFAHLRHQLSRATNAKAVYDTLNGAMKNVAESKLMARAPDDATAFYAQAIKEAGGAESGDANTTYFNARELQQTLGDADEASTAEGKIEKSAAESLEASFPGITEKIEKAAVNGEDVALPTADYIAKLAKTDLGAKMNAHARLDPNEDSWAVIQDAIKNAPETLKKLDAKVSEELQAREEREEAGKKVGRRAAIDVLKIAKEVGAPITNAQAEAFGSIVSEMTQTLATKVGKKVGDLPAVSFGKKGDPKAGDLTQPSRGSYDPARRLINLSKTASADTLIHEFTHHMWSLTLEFSRAPVMTEAVGSDVQQMFEWLGVKDTAAWDALGFDGQEKHQEAIARGMEEFFRTGKAPTIKLQPLFDRFMGWMRSVYRALFTTPADEYRKQFGEDMPVLTAEVRAVFGRMIASEDAIEHAQAVQGRMVPFETREAFPGTDEQWRDFQALQQAAKDRAIGALTERHMKALGWLAKHKARLTKDQAPEVRAAREQSGKEALEQVENEPVYALRSWLKTDASHRLDTEQIRGLMGPSANDVLTALEGQHKEGGYDIHMAAEQSGFENAQQMVEELFTAPTKADRIQTVTDEIMVRDHSELATAEGQALAIEEALHNEVSTRLAAATLRWVQGVKSPDRLTMAAVKEIARLKLLNTPIDEIKSGRYSRLEAQASREANAALNGKKVSRGKKDGIERPAVAGDRGKAAEALQRQLLNHELAKQAAKVEKEIAKQKEFFARVFQDKKNDPKVRDQDLVLAARSILASHGFGKGSKMPMEHVELLRKHNPDVFARLEPIILQAIEGWDKQPVLTLRQFRDVADAVQSLWEMADRSKQIDVDGQKIAKQAALDELYLALGASFGTPNGPQGPITEEETKAWEWGGLKQRLQRVEHWLRRADNQQSGGPFQKYLFRGIRSAFDRYMLDRAKYTKRMTEAVMALRKKGLMQDTPIAASEIGHTFTGMDQLLGAMQHMGSESNFREMLRGYGWGDWGPVDPSTNEAVFDSSRWDRMIARMWADGTVKKEHMDLLQVIWDMNAELKPLAQKTHRDAYGHYFEEVKAKPLQTPWGEYAGGYVPSKLDRTRGNNSDIPDPGDSVDGDPVENLEKSFQDMWPTVNHDWAISRVDKPKARARVIDLGEQIKHFDTVLRFIHMQLPIRDALGLLNDPNLRAAIDRTSPGAMDGMFMPWLRAVATNRMVAPALAGKTVGALLHFAKQSIGLRIMFGSVTNALQQFTGMANAARYVPLRYLWGAAGRSHLGGKEARLFVVAKSKAMAARFESHFGLLTEDFEQALNPSNWQKARGLANKYGYLLQNYTQHRADVVTWLGAYDHAKANGRAEADAVADADSIVRLSQGSRTSVDTATWERGGPGIQLLMQFNGYYMTVLNQIVAANPGADRMRAIGWSLMIPALASAAIASSLKLLQGDNDFDDEDEDGWVLDDLAWWAFAAELKGAANLIPIAGPMAGKILTNSRNNDRVGMAPVTDAIMNFKEVVDYAIENFQRLRPGGTDKPLLPFTASRAETFMRLLSDASGIPVPALIGKVTKALAGSEK